MEQVFELIWKHLEGNLPESKLLMGDKYYDALSIVGKNRYKSWVRANKGYLKNKYHPPGQRTTLSKPLESVKSIRAIQFIYKDGTKSEPIDVSKFL